MKFKLTRTSMWYDDKPLEDDRVKRMVFEKWDTRTCTEEYFNKKHSEIGETWRSKGTNHKKVHNGEWITRRLQDEEGWGIEINTLDELMQFIKDNKRVIISYQDYSSPTFGMEIYDIDKE